MNVMKQERERGTRRKKGFSLFLFGTLYAVRVSSSCCLVETFEGQNSGDGVAAGKIHVDSAAAGPPFIAGVRRSNRKSVNAKRR